MSKFLVSRGPVWITLAAVLFFHTILISLQANGRIDTSFVRSGVLRSVAPIESLVNGGFTGIGNVWGGYVALVGLHEENEALRDENERLRTQLTADREAVLEAERLRRLSGLTDTGLGKMVTARVIGRNTSQLQQNMTIDKGESHGIQRDVAVITPDGVVGRVIHTAGSYSIVQLLIDSQSAIGAMLRSTRRQAILKGNGGSELDLDYIDDDSDLKVGDEWITSGLDRVHRKGLTIGTIVSIDAQPGRKAVRIRPQVDFDRLEEVLCLTELPPRIVDPTAEPLASPN